MEGTVVAVCRSEKTGIPKTPCGEGIFIEDFGMEADAHAAKGITRQVSLLAEESIAKMQGRGVDLKPGDFAENLTIRGLELYSLPVGTRMQVGDETILEVSQIGKNCHSSCAIFQIVGSCIMPKEGIFARVIKGGTIRTGDVIRLLDET